MMMPTIAWKLIVMAACSSVLLSQALAQKPPREQQLLTAKRFAQVHRMIKPQPGELRFNEIPWLLSVWEARHKAAAEGKPILVWSGSGGAPIGVC
jgi:hypothetical protein